MSEGDICVIDEICRSSRTLSKFTDLLIATTNNNAPIWQTLFAKTVYL